MTDQFTLADTAAKQSSHRTPLRPKIGLVLGSGLGAFADSLTDATKIPYSEIPSFPQSTAIGHAGRLVSATQARCQSPQCKAASTNTRDTPRSKSPFPSACSPAWESNP